MGDNSEIVLKKTLKKNSPLSSLLILTLCKMREMCNEKKKKTLRKIKVYFFYLRKGALFFVSNFFLMLSVENCN